MALKSCPTLQIRASPHRACCSLTPLICRPASAQDRASLVSTSSTNSDAETTTTQRLSFPGPLPPPRDLCVWSSPCSIHTSIMISLSATYRLNTNVINFFFQKLSPALPPIAPTSHKYELENAHLVRSSKDQVSEEWQLPSFLRATLYIGVEVHFVRLVMPTRSVLMYETRLVCVIGYWSHSVQLLPSG
jgi:hypothetical protein